MPRISMVLDYNIEFVTNFPMVNTPIVVLSDDQDHMIIISQKDLDNHGFKLNSDEASTDIVVMHYDSLLMFIRSKCNTFSNMAMLRHAEEDNTLNVIMPHFWTLPDGISFLRNCESVVYRINEISEPFADVHLLWDVIVQQAAQPHERTLGGVQWDDDTEYGVIEDKPWLKRDED